MGNPTMQVQANGPALMVSQQTVGHVLTEMGLGWRLMWRGKADRRDIGRQRIPDGR